MAGELANGVDIRRLLGVGMESEALGDLPYEYFAIFGAGGDHAVIERIPGQKELTCQQTNRPYVGRRPWFRGFRMGCKEQPESVATARNGRQRTNPCRGQ